MKTQQRLTTSSSCAASMLFGLSGCANLSTQDRHTAIGAGAVAGAALTGDSGIGTAGGAAIGGVIGHEVDH